MLPSPPAADRTILEYDPIGSIELMLAAHQMQDRPLVAG